MKLFPAVQNALPCAWQPGKSIAVDSLRTKWPGRESGTARSRDCVGLWPCRSVGLSNPRIDDDKAHTEQIIDRPLSGQRAVVLRQIEDRLPHQAPGRLAR